MAEDAILFAINSPETVEHGLETVRAHAAATILAIYAYIGLESNDRTSIEAIGFRNKLTDARETACITGIDMDIHHICVTIDCTHTWAYKSLKG